jgi:hypothetical protein
MVEKDTKHSCCFKLKTFFKVYFPLKFDHEFEEEYEEMIEAGERLENLTNLKFLIMRNFEDRRD